MTTLDFDAFRADSLREIAFTFRGKRYPVKRDVPMRTLGFRLLNMDKEPDFEAFAREVITWVFGHGVFEELLEDLPGAGDDDRLGGISERELGALMAWIQLGFPPRLMTRGNAPAGVEDTTPAPTGSSSSPTSPASTDSTSNDPAA
jgi:hypothetical protein